MELSFASDLLSGQWVYHKDLINTHPDLYSLVKARFDRMNEENELASAAANCRALAAEERAKELALIEQVFGTSIGLDPYNPNFYTELIRALNYGLSTRAILERSIARIEAGESQIGLGALIAGYVVTAMNELIETENPAEKIGQLMMNNKKMLFADAAEKVVDELLEKAIENGLKAAFNSADFRGGEDRSLTELIDYLNMAAGSEFIRRLRQIWRLDEIRDDIIRQMKRQKTNKRNDVMKNAFKTGMQKDKWGRGGLTAEAMEEYVVAALAQGKSPNYTVDVRATGDTRIKADSMVGFNIDMDGVVDILNEKLEGATSREKNVAALRSITRSLSKLDDSFIVYTNAKNYSLGKNFKGFSGGEAISLKTFAAMRDRMGVGVGEFIGAIASIIPGAIGEDYKERIKHLVAMDLCNLLFDDVESFGAQSHGARAIHLLYLDGIYIPLSFLLYQLAIAVETAASSADKVVKPTINAPSSLLFTPPNNTGYDNWVKQRATAFDGISISITFMQNFSSLITTLFQ